MSRDRSGFATLEVILSIVILTMIGLLGYQITKTNHQTSPTTNTIASDRVKAPANITSAPEPASAVVAAESYDASASKGDVKLEIRPKNGKIGTDVEFRLTGIAFDLSDNMQIFLVDSKGYQRSLGAFVTTGTLLQTVKVPDMLFACELGGNCVVEASPTKGIGKLVITHGNALVTVISIDFELE